MRRILLIVLAVLWPLTALAQPAAPYEPGLMLRRLALTENQRALFDQLYAGAARGETDIPFPPGTAYLDAAQALDALLTDCPELCGLGNQYSLRYYEQDPAVALAAGLSYALPPSAGEALLAAAQVLVSQARGTAWDRALFLHDALCEAVTYDLSAPHQHTAYGALVEGRAGCEGYARAMVLLCRLAGIPAAMVTGEAGDPAQPHAWCLMNLGGSFVLSDPTWDDQQGLITHWYFGLSGEQMGADHRPDQTFPLPSCPEEGLTWHARAGRLVPGDPARGEAVIHEALRDFARHGAPVNLRFSDPAQAGEFVRDMDGVIAAYNAAHPDAAVLGGYILIYGEAQGCVALLPGA